jgi:crotonobetainyl-CoA:carnitine CoA-transferase CaiB-like acyl-CoA transferase
LGGISFEISSFKERYDLQALSKGFQMYNNKKPQGLLGKITVLDLADERASFCSRLMADLGARVIKVEEPGGEPSRKNGPYLNGSRHPLRSLSFFYNNLNKLSITLDIEKEEGKAIFLRIVEEADVVVETFPPGYMNKIGLSFDKLKDINPKLIMASVTGFGQKGLKSGYKSCDIVASAFGGHMYASGSPSTPPLKIFGNQSYYSASLFAAVGILIAMRKRDRDGVGTHLDISLQESMAATLEHVLLRYFTEGAVPKREGGRHWNNSFFILPCKDGNIHLTLFQQWDTLIELLDSDGMASDLKEEKWKDDKYRAENIDYIVKVVSRWTKRHRVQELFELGQMMRFPWAKIQTPEELVNDSQLKARNFFVPIKYSMNETIMCPGIPYRFDPAFKVPRKRPSKPGEDNLEIYCKQLGIPNEELKRLYSLKVL